jgi:low affinity Fe/Cu permease
MLEDQEEVIVKHRNSNGGISALFSNFAKASSSTMGRPWVFGLALLIILGWAISGPLFGFSDTWQLVINTGTTIITFLMVFLIQNTQNRDSDAIQLKLDELIRATKGAHNAVLDLEELPQEESDKLCALYQKLASDARKDVRKGWTDTGTPELQKRDR